VHYAAIFEWLVQNNLFKAAVAFFVTLILGAAVAVITCPWKAWQRRRRTQERIADSLDTSTPGGLTDLVHRLDRLLREQDREDADDNGTDPRGDRMMPGGHGGIVPDFRGGGNGANHH
jgi:hypothetical protein